MKISIVIPSYNQGQFIEDCLNSILIQKKDVELEIIVIDGDSDDQTLDVIRKYDAEINYWVSEPDNGQSHAINKGFKQATGDIICWLNSDDYFLPGSLKKIQKTFEGNSNVSLVYGDMNWVDVKKNFLRTQKGTRFNIDELIWDYCYIPQPSTFWLKNIYTTVGGVSEDIVCAMDYEYWVRIYKAGFDFLHVPTTFSCMRSYPEQKNKRLRSVSDKEDSNIRKYYLNRDFGSFELFIKSIFFKYRRRMYKLFS